MMNELLFDPLRSTDFVQGLSILLTLMFLPIVLPPVVGGLFDLFCKGAESLKEWKRKDL